MRGKEKEKQFGGGGGRKKEKERGGEREKSWVGRERERRELYLSHRVNTLNM